MTDIYQKLALYRLQTLIKQYDLLHILYGERTVVKHRGQIVGVER